jgi:hypothetical protein
MKTEKRHQGRKIRQVVRLHRAWESEGRTEGRTENDLAWRMGQAYRMGVGADMERARRRATR